VVQEVQGGGPEDRTGKRASSAAAHHDQLRAVCFDLVQQRGSRFRRLDEARRVDVRMTLIDALDRARQLCPLAAVPPMSAPQ
jgi:hypothetical protein